MKTEPIVILDPEEAAPASTPAVVVEDDAAAGGASAVVDEDADEAGALPKRAVPNADGSVTLPLRDPVTLTIRSAARGERTEKYGALTFHRLRGADIRAITAAAAEARAAVMLARSARIREPVMNALFDQMDGADLNDAARVVEHFFGPGQKTGR